MKKFILALLLSTAISFIVMYSLAVLFDARIVLERWEDGSGIIAFYYCLPWEICFG